MTSTLRGLMTFLCLVNISFILYSANVQFISTFESNHSNILKYKVIGVYVGKLKHVIQINNNSSINIREGELIVPIIRNKTARHYVILSNISASVKHTIEKDASGNIYACWNNITISKFQTFNVELNYYVVSFDINYLINSSLITNYNTSSALYQKYTQPEKLIESNDSKIVSLAKNLTTDTNNLDKKVLKIYNFVIKHLHYKIQPEEKGALWALQKGVGDCSEYSYLFVALCRAAGIPARIQAGFAFYTSNETTEDGHMWTEYYLENYGWIPVDATWRLLNAMDSKHFSSIQSIPEIIPYANFIFNYSMEPKIDEKQIVSIEPCSPNVFNNYLIENFTETVTKIKHTEFAIFLGKIFGASLIFPSEVKEVEQTFFESEIQLQNAVNFWEEQPHVTNSNVLNALENIEKTLRKAWMLIAKTFTAFISILITILAIAMFLLKQSQKEQSKESLQKFHLHDSLNLN